jgi:hypothetical protein
MWMIDLLFGDLLEIGKVFDKKENLSANVPKVFYS